MFLLTSAFAAGIDGGDIDQDCGSANVNNLPPLKLIFWGWKYLYLIFSGFGAPLFATAWPIPSRSLQTTSTTWRSGGASAPTKICKFTKVHKTHHVPPHTNNNTAFIAVASSRSQWWRTPTPCSTASTSTLAPPWCTSPSTPIWSFQSPSPGGTALSGWTTLRQVLNATFSHFFGKYRKYCTSKFRSRKLPKDAATASTSSRFSCFLCRVGQIFSATWEEFGQRIDIFLVYL